MVEKKEICFIKTNKKQKNHRTEKQIFINQSKKSLKRNLITICK